MTARAVLRYTTGTLMSPDPCRSGQRIEIDLLWVPRDPLAVSVTFHQAQWPLPVEWFVSRDLLLAGLTGPVGAGDVGVFPDLRDARRVELVMSPPHGRVGLRVRRDHLAGFLAATGDASSDLVETDLHLWLRSVRGAA